MKTLNLDSNVIDTKKSMSDKLEDDTTSVSTTIEATETPAEKSTDPLPKVKKKHSFSLKKLTAPFSHLFSTFQSLSPVKKILVACIICLIIVGIGGGAGYYIISIEKSSGSVTIPTRVAAAAPVQSLYMISIPLDPPNEPRTTPNPINGVLYTKKEYAEMQSRFPLAVIIENQVQARPQSGYNSADIVFETLAEGGITRSIAVFWGNKPSTIGPVRSMRTYYLQWVTPFDPLVMHIGYAISDDERIDVSRLIYNHTFKSLDRGGTFWRDNTRYAPHNAYTSADLLYEKAQTYGLTGTPNAIESWQFKQDATLEERGDMTSAKLVFFERLNNGGLYDITWRYDKDRNVYLRYNNDTAYTDTNTNTDVYAKNVIIQRLSVISAYDEKAHMIVTTTGTGDAIILRDGQAIYGTWQKESSENRTTYFDADGTEIEFNRGIMWVEAVPTDLGSVTIEP